MNSDTTIRKAWAHRASRLLPFTAATLLLCLSVPAHGQQASAKKKPLKPPHVLAGEISGIIRGSKTPYQMYTRYARFFQGYAVTISRQKPTSKAQKARYDWLGKTYTEMSGLLTEMGKWAKMRDAIRNGTVNTHDMMKPAASELAGNKPKPGTTPKIGVGAVPNNYYAKARSEHKALLKQFDELTLKITPKKPAK
ncbi:MAG: hypothetical protein KAI66_13015 [Lentisphaeria bacterium]|nr:hypothetical protein [Lentisphaeria bacterium]